MTHEPTDHSVAGVDFIVASEVMQKFMTMVERVARHVGTVLIAGETGAGKEMIARTIHEHSQRCSKPFVEINCATLPENLIESELFGYEKGAFSGADSAKPGLFEVANSGTIFLDEIGELDLKLQVKLLRILDHAPYYRLGGHRKISVDVRVVAATNRLLKNEVAAGRFRKDLYHRLGQFELRVPPLRERPEDILALAEHFLKQGGTDLHFSQEALHAFQSYSWPGNVREIQNVVNKIMVSANGPTIQADEVLRQIDAAATPDDEPGTAEPTTDLDQLEAQAVKKALANTGGHRGKAAEQLGISRRTLSRKLRQHGFASSRSESSAPMGSLSYEQQQAFRANLKIPVSLRSADGAEYPCTAINLSSGGMGLDGFAGTSQHRSPLRAVFLLPGGEKALEIPCRIAWASYNGRAGITFLDVDATTRQDLAHWLFQKMASEGWNVPVEPLEPTSVHGRATAASASRY